MSVKALRLQSMLLQYLAMISQEEATGKANAGGCSWWNREVFWSAGECLGTLVPLLGT